MGATCYWFRLLFKSNFSILFMAAPDQLRQGFCFVTPLQGLIYVGGSFTPGCTEGYSYNTTSWFFRAWHSVQYRPGKMNQLKARLIGYFQPIYQYVEWNAEQNYSALKEPDVNNPRRNRGSWLPIRSLKLWRSLISPAKELFPHSFHGYPWRSKSGAFFMPYYKLS